MDRTEAFESLVTKIRARGDTYAYFFDQLDSPEWLAPLAENGFFKDPPGVEDVGDGFVRLPIWPESRALARLADRAEDDVSRLILECPETDNPRVHEDFVDAALKMSAERASLVVPRIAGWLEKPYLQLLPMKAGELLHRLSILGAVDDALSLARTILRLSPSLEAIDESEGGTAEDDILSPAPKAIALFDTWDYKTILEEYVPTLVRAARIRGLALLCDHLERASTIEGARLGGPPRDLSYIWRPSIGEHEQNIDREPRDYLISGIRDGGTALISEGLAPLAAVVELLEGRGWDVFRRLALHFASEHIERDSGPGVRLMMSRDLFESMDVSREYKLLLTVAFPQADLAEREAWLGWLEEGPDLTHHIERFTSDRGEPPSGDELAERADRWRWQRIAFVPDMALPPEWLTRKTGLGERLGEPPTLPFVMSTWVGSVSPLAQSEAAALSTSELAGFADSLPASGDDRFSSPQEGFADVLQALAEEDPRKLSSGLQDFIGRKPVFVRSILQGLREPARGGSGDLDWSAVLAVAEWVMNQPREIEGGSGGSYSDLDPGWVWTRGAIADLLEEGLRPGSIPPDLAGRVWMILQSLLDDPDGGAGGDPDAATESLNCIRGKAMHAALLYANWRFEASVTEGVAPTRSFEAVAPEMTPELEAHLNPDVDPSPAVRAVFGMRLQLLMKLDPVWTAGHANQIFSAGEDGGFNMLGSAAWASYQKYGGRNIELMELLRPQFATAIASLSSSVGEVDEAERGLADRIVVLYWWGKLGDVPSEADLLRELFATGSPKVRRRALEFVGRSLREAEANLAPAIRARMQRLWEYRLEAVRAEGPAADRTELQAFGWWMSFGALDETWAVRQLLEVLQLAGKVDVDYLVVKALAKAGAPNREAALHCLLLITEADGDGWGVYGWKDDAYRLVEAGLADEEPTRQLAVDAANLLIARGFHEFRSLMQTPQSD